MAVAARCFNICIRDLNRKCTIESRSLQAPAIGEIASSVSFAVVFTGWFAVKTMASPGRSTGKGSARFAGVNVNQDTTHIFTGRYRDSLKQLDAKGEHFVHMDNRYFRILEATNYNEENKWILFQTTERGLDSKDASNA